MDLTKPIDITAVNTAVRKYQDVLKSVTRLSANEVLQYATPIPLVRDSIVLGKKVGGTILKKYNGLFVGQGDLGTIQPRTLKVFPIVGEIQDEPERYRRSFITEVNGGLDIKSHPFERFLVQDVIAQASEDLLGALFTAKEGTGTLITNAFDGWGSIIEAEKTAGNISVAKGNQYATGELTRENVMDQLLAMYRSMPIEFRQKRTCYMYVSYDVADLYDDAYADSHVALPQVDMAGQVSLEGTNGRCKIIRLAGLPAGSQMVVLTTKENMVYGYDKEADMKNVKAFEKDPYLFTAAMKFVFGCQFVSIDKREFCVNDQPLTPA